MTLLTIAVTAIVALYTVKAVRLYHRQAEHVYNPRRELSATPDSCGLTYQDVHFRSADKTLLHGWFCPCPHSQRAILLLHGNTGNISDCIASLKIFADLGFSSFVFDYRGYGHSEGHPDEQGTYHDAEAAWEWLLRERRYAPQDVVILGRSLGAAVGTWLASHHQAAAVVLESTFTSLPDIAAETHRLVPARWMTRYNYNSLERIPRIHSPIMIVHGRDDQVISYHHGQRLFAAANEPKTFMDIDGDHSTGFLHSGRRYIDGLQAFLNQYCR